MNFDPRRPEFACAKGRTPWTHGAPFLVSMLMTLVAIPARAQSSEVGHQSSARTVNDAGTMARLHFETANLAFEEERYREAAREFEAAHQLKPHAAVLFNAAQAWQLADEPGLAADDFAQALARSELTEEQSRYARQALKALRQELGWVDVAGDRGIQALLDGRSVTVPFMSHLAPGAHRLTATDQAGESWTEEFTVEADRPLKLYLRKPSIEPEPITPHSSELPPSPQRDWQLRRTMGTVGLGAGAAFAVGSALLGIATLNTNKKFEQSGYHDQSLHDRALSLRTWTNVFALSGAVVGSAGIILLLTDSPREELTVRLSPDRVALHRHF